MFLKTQERSVVFSLWRVVCEGFRFLFYKGERKGKKKEKAEKEREKWVDHELQGRDRSSDSV